MTDLIPIGRFALITHLSVKALRIYAQEGLLQPMYVDPESGYRYYALAQATLAARIRLLRLVEMPLEEIRAILQTVDPEAVQAHLTHHRQRITDRIARDQQSLLLLQRVRDQPDAFLSFEVQIKEVPDQPLLSLSVHAGYGAFGQVHPLGLRYLDRLCHRDRRLLARATSAGHHSSAHSSRIPGKRDTF
jgi:DNA-binding transcriptional MerR regulator